MKNTTANTVFIFIFSVIMCLVPCQIYGQSTNFEGKKLLIYTKNGKGYVHENIATSVATVIQICKELGVEYSVSNDPTVFTHPDMMDYDAVLFSNTNNEAFDDYKQKEAFKTFCQSGKGFGGIHSAIGSERDWPWFWKLIGGSFLRHPPFQTFTIKVNRTNHTSTKHLPLEFESNDECYFIKNINPSFKILLEADLTTVSENPNNQKVFRPTQAPLSWYNTFEGGKQWYTALGHSADLYSQHWFVKHLQGGIEYILQD